MMLRGIMYLYVGGVLIVLVGFAGLFLVEVGQSLAKILGGI